MDHHDRISLMRVMVTGGAGYVGSVTVEGLLAAGHEVTVLDNLSTGHADAVPSGATLVEGSFGDRAVVGGLLRDRAIDVVLHCGARSLVGESMAQPGVYYQENVVGGMGLLDAMRDSGVERIVLSSTAAVYGVPRSIPILEDDAKDPVNPYGATKLAFEGMLRSYAAYGLRSVSLRYFNVAGASERNGERHDPETHLIPNLLTAAMNGTPATLFGTDYPTLDGTPIRDYIHVMDLADAHLAALSLTETAEPGLEAMNLGSGSGFSVRQVLAATETVVGRQVPVAFGPRRAGDPPILVASNRLAATRLGWTPKRGSLNEMIGSAWRLASAAHSSALEPA